MTLLTAYGGWTCPHSEHDLARKPWIFWCCFSLGICRYEGIRLLPGFLARGFSSRADDLNAESASGARSQYTSHTMLPGKQGMYDPALERDNCGVGMIANLKKTESHRIVKNALQVSLKVATLLSITHHSSASTSKHKRRWNDIDV